MPSDDRLKLALDALTPNMERFLAALGGAADDIKGQLGRHRSSQDGRATRLAAELGPFAAGRIDPDRFATLANLEPPVDPVPEAVLRQAQETLASLRARGLELFLVNVVESGSLRDTVATALTAIGRAFAAARAVREARSGGLELGKNGGPGAPLPFSRWTRAERRLAPPLVVRTLGSDLQAAGLAEFLDGAQKIVLVVEGECAPAVLVRLVTPGTFVLQTHDGAGLDRLAAWDGPGVAAVVPESAAQFIHDPAAGSSTWDRFTVTHLPERPPRRAVGGVSPAQQAEELELLRTLATRPATAAPAAAVGTPAAPSTPSDPADRLAAWLLGHADLTDLG